MNLSFLLAPLCLFNAIAFAAELPTIPAKSIAEKKELLFSDDFESAEPAKVWHKVVPTFVFEKGMLKGTQTRDKDVPAADGKPAIKAHAAVHGLEIPTKDSVVEVKIRFEGATMIDVEFDDRKYTGSHYGHICRAQVRLNGVTIIDERDGGMRNDIQEMRKDPAKKAEVAKLLIGRSVTYPAKLESGQVVHPCRRDCRRRNACHPRRQTRRLPQVLRHRPRHASPRSSWASPARTAFSTTSRSGMPKLPGRNHADEAGEPWQVNNRLSQNGDGTSKITGPVPVLG